MKKKFKVELTESAQSDIIEIWDYIASNNPKNAKVFINQIEKQILSLENYPLKRPLIPENFFLETQYRHILYKDYRIIYRCNKKIYILRVIHGSKLLELD